MQLMFAKWNHPNTGKIVVPGS